MASASAKPFGVKFIRPTLGTRTWLNRGSSATLKPFCEVSHQVGARFFEQSAVDAGKITGNVFSPTGATPATRLVVLFERQSFVRVSATYSRASDGYFEFKHLCKDYEYFVVAFDVDPPNDIRTPTKRAEACDQLVPG